MSVQHSRELMERMGALVREGLPFEDRMRLNPRIAIGRRVRYARSNFAPESLSEGEVIDASTKWLLVRENDGSEKRVRPGQAKFL